ncbi:MAG: isochorismatase family protein [Chloroflexi bacterium]|nr:isochorismatase family protein [Chloroflexota bacterium]
MAIWDDVISQRDKEVYAKAGYHQRQGFGRKPAILVIDVNYDFVGDRPEPILKSIERFRNSCGEEGWAAVHKTQELLSAARAKGIPVCYSTSAGRQRVLDAGRWAGKNIRAMEVTKPEGHRGSDIVDDIAPQEGDIVIYKDKPSVFFGTTLMSRLNYLGVDTLLCCGCTTSGCVRATVLDAFSYNFRVGVVQECTFDRGQVSHKINLYDMNAKYADVVALAEVKDYLASL